MTTAMAAVITLVTATLKAGMTTGKTASDLYYVKTWYSSDPLTVPAPELPAAAVIPDDQPLQDTFVGQDTVISHLRLRFYQPAWRTWNGGTPNTQEAPENAAGMTRLVAMMEQARLLLRTDPTFASQFVYSKIIGAPYYRPGVLGANNSRMGEITFQAWNRALWGQ